MNIAELEAGLNDLVATPFEPSEFGFGLVAACEKSTKTLKSLRDGTFNKGTGPQDLVWKKKLFFRPSRLGDIDTTMAAMRLDPAIGKNKVRIVLTTDGDLVSAFDTKTGDDLQIEFSRLAEEYEFLLPLAGRERHDFGTEKDADVRATAKIARFFDAVKEKSSGWQSHEARNQMNVFLARAMFCLFAEDTGIFDEKGMFTKALLEHTHPDGSDVDRCLHNIFTAMSRENIDRPRRTAPYAMNFPYANGGLFEHQTDVPAFTPKARRILIECGSSMNWSEINPDIFGSMMQAVVHEDKRGDLGMHYTSVPNIMKVLKPLFLDSLRNELNTAGSDERRLRRLHDRLAAIQVFDPACGSGNFLIVAYKEIRRLEIEILDRLRQASFSFSKISLNNFHGIEYDHFAHETAKLSLWIAEHQMNLEAERRNLPRPSALPLRDAGHIVCGNALHVDWEKHCPAKVGRETYVVGNPPYLGSTYQNADQKADVAKVFSNYLKTFRNLDYVACWYALGARYVSATGAQCAFVTTNSICQGEQVDLLWPHVFSQGIEIGFAYKSFKWKNLATKNAGVTCVIVGIRKTSGYPKILFDGDVSAIVSNIGPYLTATSNSIVSKRTNSVSNLPTMSYGNKPTEGGNLILSPSEKDEIVETYPHSAFLFRRLYGSQEFIKGIERWCLWITSESDLELARSIPPVKARIEACRTMRIASVDLGCNALASRPHQFRDMNEAKEHMIVVPKVSSERRRYLPVGLVDNQAIASDLVFAIYDAPMHVFAILSSKHHRIWTEAVGGKLKTDYRYSNTLVYNTFPLPTLNERQTKTFEDLAWRIIEERSRHLGKTIAELYDPETMPAELLAVHREVDDAMDAIYSRKFRDDAHRLDTLMKLYATMTANESKARKETKIA